MDIVESRVDSGGTPIHNVEVCEEKELPVVGRELWIADQKDVFEKKSYWILKMSRCAHFVYILYTNQVQNTYDTNDEN
jgi:hypothetical protein